MDTDAQGMRNKCGCECCRGSEGCCGRSGRHVAHIIIKICIAVFIFWCGVQFGELKALLHRDFLPYGYGMMGGWGGQDQIFSTDGYGMMGGLDTNSTTAAPAASATPAKR